MKWILFTGTWRRTNADVERDVRAKAREVVERGDGILTGGATGVDYFAMDEALKVQPAATHLRVIIPALLESYLADYYQNWCQDPITKEDIDRVGDILTAIRERNPASLLEMPYKIITQEHYDMRNEQEVLYATELYAFQVNNSTGTQYTIDKAVSSGVPVIHHYKYDIV